MKKTKIAYWIITVLFAGFMLFSAIPDALNTADAQAFMNGKLGYPNYISPFLGIAKILGAIAILIPGFPRIKEWAYAGLIFDLLGATYSIISSGDNGSGLAFMTVIIAVGFTSYALYHKVNKPVLSLAV